MKDLKKRLIIGAIILVFIWGVNAAAGYAISNALWEIGTIFFEGLGRAFSFLLTKIH